MNRTVRFFMLLLCLALLGTSCSKDKDTNQEKTKTDRKAASSRVVDLGENGADQNGIEKAAPTRSVRDKAAVRGARPVPEKELSREEIARKNEEVRNREDRGKPAAQLDAEEVANKGHQARQAAPEPAPQAAPESESAPAVDLDFAEANDEPEEITPRIVQKRQGLNIADLINIREFREKTGYAGTIIQGDLPGQPDDSRYNVIRLATDKDSQLGFVMQVWKPGNDSAASKRFEDLYKQSFGGVKQKEVATDAFLSNHHGINELGFYDKGKRAVVLLSCTSTICSADSLKNIAGMLQRRL